MEVLMQGQGEVLRNKGAGEGGKKGSAGDIDLLLASGTRRRKAVPEKDSFTLDGGNRRDGDL